MDTLHLGEITNAISPSEARLSDFDPTVLRNVSATLASLALRSRPDLDPEIEADRDVLRDEIRDVLKEMGLHDDPDSLRVNPLTGARSRRG